MIQLLASSFIVIASLWGTIMRKRMHACLAGSAYQSIKVLLLVQLGPRHPAYLTPSLLVTV